ncbi:MAG: cytidine deaminase [Polyangiaceae bacterium]
MKSKSPAKKPLKRAPDFSKLIDAAKRARKNAYAPYSNYLVGAALLTKSGKIFAGCNFENASYGACICAERNAVGQMIAAGEREPVACVVVTGGNQPGSPCGICRQVLAEFAADMPVILVNEFKGGEMRRDTSLSALLPDAFDRANLGS